MDYMIFGFSAHYGLVVGFGCIITGVCILEVPLHCYFFTGCLLLNAHCLISVESNWLAFIIYVEPLSLLPPPDTEHTRWLLFMLCRLVSLELQLKNTRLLLKMPHPIYLLQSYKIIVICKFLNSSFHVCRLSINFWWCFIFSQHWNLPI